MLAGVAILLSLSAAALAAPPAAPQLAGPSLHTGKRLSLSSFAGRPVVVNLWASWCGGCIYEAPTLSRFSREHPRVAMLGVNTMDSKASARAFTRRHGLSFPSIFDPHGRLFARLRSPGLPATFFLDRRHRIVLGIPGALTQAQLEAGLRAARSS